MPHDLQARVAALAARGAVRAVDQKQANREQWPEIAELVAGFTAVFGPMKGYVMPDGRRYGKPVEFTRAVQASPAGDHYAVKRKGK